MVLGSGGDEEEVSGLKGIAAVAVRQDSVAAQDDVELVLPVRRLLVGARCEMAEGKLCGQRAALGAEAKCSAAGPGMRACTSANRNTQLRSSVMGALHGDSILALEDLIPKGVWGPCKSWLGGKFPVSSFKIEDNCDIKDRVNYPTLAKEARMGHRSGRDNGGGV